MLVGGQAYLNFSSIKTCAQGEPSRIVVAIIFRDRTHKIFSNFTAVMVVELDLRRHRRDDGVNKVLRNRVLESAHWG